jgi:hypothetical protein
MEDRVKQTEAFAQMLGTMNVPAAERPQVMRGGNLFFDRGWPSNHFTVGMAARAGAGLVPPVYEGLDSVARPVRRRILKRMAGTGRLPKAGRWVSGQPLFYRLNPYLTAMWYA